MTKIQDYLKTFDVQDRYDFDEDGDFFEPDGYIDHFQIVHAGGDEADGDPIYGADAIWSHRGNVGIHGLGDGPGPAIGGVQVGEGGPSDGGAVQIPNNPTGIWVSDYTIQPENGGLSVFSHEFGHDLGLPDLYDTSGNSGGASNSVEQWSLMASRAAPCRRTRASVTTRCRSAPGTSSSWAGSTTTSRAPAGPAPTSCVPASRPAAARPTAWSCCCPTRT